MRWSFEPPLPGATTWPVAGNGSANRLFSWEPDLYHEYNYQHLAHPQQGDNEKRRALKTAPLPPAAEEAEYAFKQVDPAFNFS